MLSSTLATVVFSLASLNYVSANPISGRDAQYPEVVPGEGLPSLESLGLTTAMLYETPLPAIRSFPPKLLAPILPQGRS